MNWMEGISNAINYMEMHLTDEIVMEEAAKQAAVSGFYFQRAFRILCGYSVSEYIRYRRLSLAGSDVVATDKRIIDIALEYGYESADSFTKAFTRFHGATPTAVRRGNGAVKSFAPVQIQFSLKGGYAMEYRIAEKEAFTVMGISKRFQMDRGNIEAPKFWSEHWESGRDEYIRGMFGICVDDGEDDFRYMIADLYQPGMELPDWMETIVIPRQTWAVFPCKGPVPDSLQKTEEKIFSEWLPNNSAYEVAEHYNVEMYTCTADYEKGNADESYCCEIWIPVKKRQVQMPGGGF